MAPPATLLITGAIDISAFQVPYTRLTDTKVRLQQYIDSLEYAIDNYHRIHQIVFCENTGYRYDYSELLKKAEQKGKELEIISFSGNYQTIQVKGKGYGEGEIVEYALKNSRTLQNCVFFYKLTGRIMVRNMDQLMDRSPSDNTFIFFSDLKGRFEKGKVRTLFYKVNTSFYKQNLIDAYMEADDNRHHYLEHVFYDRLAKIPLPSFGKFPDFAGIQASTGKLYQTKLKLIKYRLYHRLHFYSNMEKTLFQKMILQIIKTIRFAVPG